MSFLLLVLSLYIGIPDVQPINSIMNDKKHKLRRLVNLETQSFINRNRPVVLLNWINIWHKVLTNVISSKKTFVGSDKNPVWIGGNIDDLILSSQIRSAWQKWNINEFYFLVNFSSGFIPSLYFNKHLTLLVKFMFILFR